MVKKGKKIKKDVGSAAVGAAPGEGADGSGARFALEGMGLALGALPTGAVGGSGEEITSAEPPGPPAHSMLDDMVSQPAEVDPSSGGGADRGGDRHSGIHPRAAR